MVATRMTRTEQANRRKQMAAAVTGWDSMGRVAAKFDVSIQTVKNACQIYAPHKLGAVEARSRHKAAG